jgi:hypothetical protein
VADRLDFEIDVELETGLITLITGHARVPGLIEAFRETGTPAVLATIPPEQEAESTTSMQTQPNPQ